MLACLPGPGDLPLQLLPHTQMNTGHQKCKYSEHRHTHSLLTTTSIPHNKPSCFSPAAHPTSDAYASPGLVLLCSFVVKSERERIILSTVAQFFLMEIGMNFAIILK